MNKKQRLKPIFSVSISESVLLELDKVAEARGVSRSRLIEEILVEWLKANRETAKSTLPGVRGSRDPLARKVLDVGDRAGWTELT